VSSYDNHTSDPGDDLEGPHVAQISHQKQDHQQKGGAKPIVLRKYYARSIIA
jgi:hypothetical protein